MPNRTAKGETGSWPASGSEAYFVKHSNIQSQTTNIDIVHEYVCEFGLCISAPF